MTLNDQAILLLATVAMAFVLCDAFSKRPRRIFLELAVLCVAMLPIVKRFLFV